MLATTDGAHIVIASATGPTGARLGDEDDRTGRTLGVTVMVGAANATLDEAARELAMEGTSSVDCDHLQTARAVKR